jgi:uncharacterized protein
MKKFLFIFSLVLLFVFSLFLYFSQIHTKPFLIGPLGEVIMAGKVFLVHIADTDIARESGLSGWSQLSDDQGMFFVFEKTDDYGFWMKDMNFPIDIIWIDQNFKINHIENEVSPATFPKAFYGGPTSLYVLEVSAGEARKLGVLVGDFIKFNKK